MKMQWHKIRCIGSRKRAENLTNPAPLRLFFLAVANAGPGGHACFAPGELREELLKVNASTGEVSQYSHRALSNQIDALVAGGVLGPESTEHCLVVPMDLIDSAEPFRAKPCPVHGHWQHSHKGQWIE